MPIEYKNYPLIKPTVINRRFKQEIQPPQLVSAENFIVSRSDDSLVIRPDFRYIEENLLGRSDNMYFGGVDVPGDFLNSAVGIWGTDSLVFFSRYLPYTANASASNDKSGQYTTGTVDCTAGGTTLTENGAAGATEWLTKVWPGCLLSFASDNNFYIVKSVTDDDELEITGTFQNTFANKGYVIYLTHSSFHSLYKLNVQTYASGLIYNAPPEAGKDILARNIHGPLYAGVTESTTTATPIITRDSLADWTWETNNEGHFLAQLGTENKGPWIAFSEDSEAKLMYSVTNPNIDVNNDWTLVDLTDYQSGLDSVSRVTVGGINKNLCNFGAIDSSVKEKYIGFIGHGDVSGVSFTIGNIYFLEDADLPTISDPGFGFNDYSPFPCGIAWEEKNLFVYASLYDDTSDQIVGIHTTPLDTLLEYIVNGEGSAPVWTEAYNSTTAGGGVGRPQDMIIGGGYCCLVEFSNVVYSSDGSTWTLGTTGSSGSANSSAAYSSKHDRWVIINFGEDKVYYASGTPATARWNTISVDFTGFPYFLHWDEIGEVFYAVGDNQYYYVSKTGLSWSEGDLSGLTNYNANDRYAGVAFYKDESANNVYFIGGNSSVVDLCSTKYLYETKTTYATASFAPVSDIYRATTFSVLEGYLVLCGTRETEDSGATWTYYPRRIRWTAPFTVTDFTSTGSGVADLTGHGAILDARPVNGRIVTFETSGIGVISPRNVVDDPWDYEKIYSSLINLSNPVVVEDVCFFIAQDGLLYQTDGIEVSETGSSFDMSQFSDFDETAPIWLIYSKLLNSLLVYSPNLRDGLIHVINLNNGCVTSLKTFDATIYNLKLKSIVSVEESGDRRFMICYGPDPDDVDTLVTLEMKNGWRVRGLDEPNTTAASDNHWHAQFTTGEIDVVKDGDKTFVPHFIINTFTEALTGTNEDRPDIVILTKSTEDTQWHGRGSTAGTTTITSSACTGSGTAFSNLIGRAGTEVDGVETDFTLPCQANQARIYLESGGTYTLQSAYTTSGTTVSFTSAPANTYNLYAYWDGYPEVKCSVGDYIYSPLHDSWHRITAINTATNLTLAYYPASGTDTSAVHHFAEQMPDGEDEVKLGMHKLVDQLQVRFIVIPRSDKTNQSSTAKVTEFSIGLRPHGKRLVEATGE